MLNTEASPCQRTGAPHRRRNPATREFGLGISANPFKTNARDLGNKPRMSDGYHATATAARANLSKTVKSQKPSPLHHAPDYLCAHLPAFSTYYYVLYSGWPVSLTTPTIALLRACPFDPSVVRLQMATCKRTREL